MELRQFAVLVRQMRDSQKEYFDRNRRRPLTMTEAKALERQVDQTIAEILDEHPSLFEQENNP